MNPVAMDALHELEKLEAHAACIKVEYGIKSFFFYCVNMNIQQVFRSMFFFLLWFFLFVKQTLI